MFFFFFFVVLLAAHFYTIFRASCFVEVTFIYSSPLFSCSSFLFLLSWSIDVQEAFFLSDLSWLISKRNDVRRTILVITNGIPIPNPDLGAAVVVRSRLPPPHRTTTDVILRLTLFLGRGLGSGDKHVWDPCTPTFLYYILHFSSPFSDVFS